MADKALNKVELVPAYFEAVGKDITVKVPTGETKMGFFGGVKDVTRKEKHWTQTGWSDCHIDRERLADDLSNVVESLNNEGYEVVSVTPVTSGSYASRYELRSGGSDSRGFGGYGYGYGYSFTNSLIVIAKNTV